MISDWKRKPLDFRLLNSMSVILFCHFSVALLCVNVMYDLFFFGFPLHILNSIGLIPTRINHKIATFIINWTTPTVYGIPMVLSGTKVYIDNVDVLIEAKESNSLLLANHGSRFDWMVGMFVGHLKCLGDKRGRRSRVGFVCEALIQFMPLVGWYRKIICNDIFVWRSFKKDEPAIKKNISAFLQAEESRMLFLSPEGVVVDNVFEKDTKYIHECRSFCIKQGYKPLDYVLTPRYKGTACLLEQVSGGGCLISLCLVFVRDGKLLNCKLLSDSRVIPDLYDLNQGISGKPISIFIHARKLQVSDSEIFDPKSVLMAEYEWKDTVIADCEKLLDEGNIEWHSQFTKVEGSIKEVYINHVLHILAILLTVKVTGFKIFQFLHLFFGLFCVITMTHTIGCFVNSTSMESVPFETGIKAIFNCRRSGTK